VSIIGEEDTEPPSVNDTALATRRHARAEHSTSPAPDAARHRQLIEGEFWRDIPAYSGVAQATFLDHHWQSQHAVTRVDKLAATLGSLLPEPLFRDVEAGMARASMSLRISPYILSLIDWNDPYGDPLRKQFLPLASEQVPDHPMVGFDSLHEQHDSPVPGLVHRYPDKALFLALDLCPVYCRFCTRSYSVGVDTEGVSKLHLRAKPERWDAAFEYIRNTPQLEDIVISGGDVHNLRADQIAYIGHNLLDIPHVRRMRFATKAVAVVPMKFLSDDEFTWITQAATRRLHADGVTVRNQCVMLRGVNDDASILRTLVRRLSYVNVQPYYVYQHDLVPGVEDLRTSLAATLGIEKHVRGSTAGFNTPTFVLDAPGGGGKRDVHSFEHYDRTTGVSVFRSPNVDEHAVYVYFDPVETLPEEGKRRWADPNEHATMISNAVLAAGHDVKQPLAAPSVKHEKSRRLPVM
jgi:lysine 2,3-aminomutase